MRPEPLDPVVYVRVFEGDPNGAAILEELTRVFARPAVTAGGIDAILQTYQHAGQRRVLDFIVSKINQAHGVRDGSDTDND